MPDGVERVEELVHFAVALWLVQTTWDEIRVTSHYNERLGVNEKKFG
tara:strand:- start:226 stop:366 length:141 start_codon:yes stop_codon:yes gene_type:complete